MNQANQGNNFDAPPGIPVKRKRGRPRKDQSLIRVESARATPRYERVNGIQSHQVDPLDGANDGMVGQAVTGFVEAAFDAGYLLAVKIGNSNTYLRGVVFKPGHYAPITAENDVAPNVQMIRRNVIHRVRGRNARSRERNEVQVNYLGNGSPPANQVHKLAPQMGNLVSPKGKYASAMVVAPSVPLVGARGTVVPVVLQPVNLSNGLPPANQVSPSASQAAHMMALKGKHVQTVAPLAVYPPNGSTNQVLAIARQALPSQTKTSPQVTPKGGRNENGPFNHSTPELRRGEEAKSTKSTVVVTPGEVIKGVRGSSQPADKAACKSSASDSAVAPERDIVDMNEPLFIEPLQTMHSDLHNQTASVTKTVENSRTGRMTELLQALQENFTENQVPRVEHFATGTKVEFHEPKSPETDVRDEDTFQS